MAHKTTNQLLSAVCWVRTGESPNESEDAHASQIVPFSRATEAGEADVATNGRVMVAVFGRGAHYATTAGPKSGHVFLRENGELIPNRGAAVAISVRGLRSWCLDAPLAAPANGKKTKLRPVYLVAEKEPSHHMVVDADSLLSVLAFMRGDVEMVIPVGSTWGPSLENLGLTCLTPWDGGLGVIRALVVAARCDRLEDAPKVMLLPPGARP